MSRSEIKEVINSQINKVNKSCGCDGGFCELCNGCFKDDDLKAVDNETLDILIKDFEDWLDSHDESEAKNFDSLGEKRKQMIISELTNFGIKNFMLNNYDAICEDCYEMVADKTNTLIKTISRENQVEMMNGFFDWYDVNILTPQEKEIEAKIKMYQEQHQMEKG